MRRTTRKRQGGFIGWEVGSDQIEAAALQVFELGGPEAVSTRNIARFIGCSPAALYNKFPGIGPLQSWVARNVLLSLAVEFLAAKESYGGRELVLAQMRIYRSFWQRNRRSFAFVFGPFGRYPGGWQFPYVEDQLNALTSMLGSPDLALSWWARFHGLVDFERMPSFPVERLDRAWAYALADLDAALERAERVRGTSAA